MTLRYQIITDRYHHYATRIRFGLILNRITLFTEGQLIKEQAGFRAGKSCTFQLLNRTQHIDDGYQMCMITGIAFSSSNGSTIQLTMYSLLKHATQPKSPCGAEQRASGFINQKNVLTINHSTMKRVTSATQTIYVSQPNILQLIK